MQNPLSAGFRPASSADSLVQQRQAPRVADCDAEGKIHTWLRRSAAYLHASQPQPALLLLQHAIASTYSKHPGPSSELGAESARQLAGEWLTLVPNVIKDAAVPGGLTLLLFPAPQQKQAFTPQVRN